MTQKAIILEHLRFMGEWMPAYKLRSVSTAWGFIGHQGDRRLRELANEGKLEVRRNGKYAEYRFKRTIGIVEELAKLKTINTIKQERLL